MLVLPEAVFQPSVDPTHIHTDGSAQHEAGMLLLVDDRWFMVAIEEGGKVLIDIKAGTTVSGMASPIRVLFGLGASSKRDLATIMKRFADTW